MHRMHSDPEWDAAEISWKSEKRLKSLAENRTGQAHCFSDRKGGRKPETLMTQRKPPLRVTSQRRFAGADDRIRTGDLILTKDALYRLSYISALSCDNVDIISHLPQKCKGFWKKILRKAAAAERSGFSRSTAAGRDAPRQGRRLPGARPAARRKPRPPGRRARQGRPIPRPACRPRRRRSRR